MATIVLSGWQSTADFDSYGNQGSIGINSPFYPKRLNVITDLVTFVLVIMAITVVEIMNDI